MLVMSREFEARIALQDFLSFDTPAGYRAEFIDGEIVVTPPPDGNHERAIDQIVWQVFRESAEEMSFAGTKGLVVPGNATKDGGRAIPDATFAARQLDLFHNAPSWMDPSQVAMVAEVTSSRPEVDRIPKRRAYAEAGIPLYVLIDRKVRRVTLFSDPAGDDYKRAIAVNFGEKVYLPKPFDFSLDTASFDE